MLDTIIEYKKNEVAAKKALGIVGLEKSLERRDFLQALKEKKPAVIAEIKKASPSKGLISQNFNVERIAQSYQAHGAACLSVLTDEKFFQGCDTNLKIAKNASTLPILRKDFIVDDWQIVESDKLGADAILLIAAVLDDVQLNDYYQLASSLSLTTLFEVHDAEELERVLKLNPPLIGINNRNLKTFTTAIETSITLASEIPEDTIIVSESGINTREDIQGLQRHNINTFLIGESLMREDDPGKQLAALIGANG